MPRTIKKPTPERPPNISAAKTTIQAAEVTAIAYTNIINRKHPKE